jgi:hypothetical protein
MKGFATLDKSTLVEKTISTKLNKYSLRENKTFFHYNNFKVPKLHYSSIKNKDQSKNLSSPPKRKL